jgi:anti-sigma factor RsiW
MTREFPDELLSAFLDDEVSPTERSQVEQHLAGSEADRQLLAELKSLRSDVASLPQVPVSADFADRVVRAALTEAERQAAPMVPGAADPTSPAKRRPRSWMIGGAIASAVALAACFLVVVQPWQKSPVTPGLPLVGVPPIETAAVGPVRFANVVRQAAPAEGEAIVVRLRVNRNVSLDAALDAALRKVGIESLASDQATAAAAWQDAYRRHLEAMYGPTTPGVKNDALARSTVAAAEALFIEATLDRLDGVFAELAAGVKEPLQLSSEGKLALAGGRDNNGGEGERAEPHPFAQRLKADFFRLEKARAGAANSAVKKQSVAPPIKPQQTVRVLILVETE